MSASFLSFVCRCCGRSFLREKRQTGSGGYNRGNKPKWHSKACKTRAFNLARGPARGLVRVSPHGPDGTRQCDVCGDKYQPLTDGQRFCGPGCATRAPKVRYAIRAARKRFERKRDARAGAIPVFVGKPPDPLVLSGMCERGHVLSFGYETVTGYGTESCPCGTRRTRRGLPQALVA